VSWISILLDWLLPTPLDAELPPDTVKEGDAAWADICFRKCLRGKSTPEHRGTVLGMLAGKTGVAWNIDGRTIVYCDESRKVSFDRTSGLYKVHTRSLSIRLNQDGEYVVGVHVWATKDSERNYSRYSDCSVKVDSSMRVEIS